MTKTDKDFIESKLRKAISLVYKDQTAQALREIADAVSVVAVALESSQPGPQAITIKPALILDHAENSHEHRIITTEQGEQFATGRGRMVRPSQGDAAATRQITESAALDTVKPLCLSGLMAALSDGGKNPQCPACGLFHERRVVVVPLSLLGYEFVEANATLRIGFEGMEKFKLNDRIVFSDRYGNISRGYVGDVTEIKTEAGKDIRREAITKVTTL